ncbi:MAG: hypothetical protein AB7G34_11785 [Hyphomicrobiales bacterium]
MRSLLGVSFAAAILAFAVSPSQAAPGFYGPGYHEWQTDRPFSGFRRYGTQQLYCDYIRYPKRTCHDRKVCRSGKCWSEPVCKVTGWEIRQSCY